MSKHILCPDRHNQNNIISMKKSEWNSTDYLFRMTYIVLDQYMDMLITTNV